MFDLFNSHFDDLDKAIVSPQSIFAEDTHKVPYESLLMYALRKYEAATYHVERVKALIEEEKNLISSGEKAISSIGATQQSTVNFRQSQTVDAYIYELSAFLSALKSAIDFLAEACSSYLPGIVTNHSISPLLKCSKKNHSGPIFDAIRQNEEWLRSLREYRDNLLHRMVPSARNGFHIEKYNTQIAKVYLPVLVPEKTPDFKAYTRSTRTRKQIMQNNELDLFILERSLSKITHPDGTEEIIHFSLDAVPVEGYKPIDEFMEKQLQCLQDFFSQIFQAFGVLKFEPQKVQ